MNASSRPEPEPLGEASRECIDAHYGRIHRAAWLMTGDAWEADDLTQETFAVAIDRWDRFQGRSSEATWLYGILVRLAKRRSRSLARMRRRMLRYLQGRDDDRNDDPQILLLQQQWRESVWAEVSELPQPQRDAVVLRFAEGLGYDAIAAILGCATGTAKTRVHHGIKRLRGRHAEWAVEESELPPPMGMPRHA